MPLPQDFSEWEHLQRTVMYAHNKTVKEFFKSQADDDINTPKSSAKHACLMKDNDTSAIAVMRLWFFWVMCRKMRDNFEPYYGIPVTTFDSEVLYHPQITLFFLEDPDPTTNNVVGFRQVEGQLSIRLITETSGTLSKGNLTTLANKINSEFGGNDGFIWQKGKDLYSYVDKPKGHRFKVLAQNKTDAIEIIRKLLSIAGDAYSAGLLRLNKADDPSDAFPSNPGSQTILGKTYKEPRRRPVAKVRFQYASIKIHGLPKPIVLVDETGYWSEAIIKAWRI
jgi:hypothetical protein